MYNNVAAAIQSIRDDPGGTLYYDHYNLFPGASGSYDLKPETTFKTSVTALRFLV
ncbi:hypothetical protein N6H14_09640 [Paenibacillus sp. CC-CFT747]|nr:hypothetical protein N6H14_09640 [Paenibacillus sp. CC-CFT747]